MYTFVLKFPYAHWLPGSPLPTPTTTPGPDTIAKLTLIAPPSPVTRRPSLSRTDSRSMPVSLPSSNRASVWVGTCFVLCALCFVLCALCVCVCACVCLRVCACVSVCLSTCHKSIVAADFQLIFSLVYYSISLADREFQ